MRQAAAWWNGRWGRTGRRDLALYTPDRPDTTQHVILAREGTDLDQALRCWVLPDRAHADHLATHLMDDQDGWRPTGALYGPLSFDPTQLDPHDLTVFTDPTSAPPQPTARD